MDFHSILFVVQTTIGKHSLPIPFDFYIKLIYEFLVYKIEVWDATTLRKLNSKGTAERRYKSSGKGRTKRLCIFVGSVNDSHSRVNYLLKNLGHVIIN